MKKQSFVLLTACTIAIGSAVPSFAGVLGSVAGLFGSTTAAIIDTPEGVLVDSLYRVPYKTSKSLAADFGDENGLGQKAAGALIGIPTGFVVGIPYGAVHGFSHGWTAGWEKPFSTDSFLVTDESK